MSQPDLFVVCKNCGSEVSPYVTECPYCGQRVRKRAPKIDRDGEASRRSPSSAAGRALPRLRAEEIEGIAPDTRPYATIALIAVSLVVSLVWRPAAWSLLTTSADRGAGQRRGVALLHHAVRARQPRLPVRRAAGSGDLRHAARAPLRAGAGRARLPAGGRRRARRLAVALDAPPLLDDRIVYPVLGANGAALGCSSPGSWTTACAARRGDERGNDLIGVYVIAACWCCCRSR